MADPSSFTYTELRASFPHEKKRSDPMFCRFFLRPLSFPVAWFLCRMGRSANQITLASMALSLAAFVVLIPGAFFLSFTAAILLLTVALGDCVDGNIARLRGDSGPSGEWMDALCGYTVYALLPLALGLQLELVGAHSLFAGMWVLVGAVTAISNLYLRLVYQKYVNSVKPIQFGEDDAGEKSGLLSRISGEVGLVGWMMPALLVAVLLGVEPLYLLFYCAFYFTAAVVGTIVLARRILRTG